MSNDQSYATDIIGSNSDDAHDAQMRVIASVLAGRILDAGGEVVIPREEYNRFSQANIDADRGLMVHVEADVMTVRYIGIAEGEAIIAEDLADDMAERLADPLVQAMSAMNLSMIEALTDRIIAQGEVPDPDMAIWLIDVLPQLDAHADPNAHRAADAVRRALDAVTPGWRALGPSGSAVDAPTAQA